MSISIRAAIAITALVICASTAKAQETFATLIENVSTATVETTPTTIVFNLTGRFQGDSFKGMIRNAQSFAPNLRTALEEEGYERATVRVTGPMIPNAETKRIRIDAEVRLGLGTSSAEGTRSTAFAAAVDTISKIAATLECDLDGPALDVGDRSALENRAVQRAIENAFTRAQSAATVMRLEIVSVDHVTIESITWHDRPGSSQQEASADSIGVTAEIRIAYLALPPGN
jgi:uncharacterized protein YggE